MPATSKGERISANGPQTRHYRLTLVDNDQDSLPRLVGLSQLGMGDVENWADIVKSVVELLGTQNSHSGRSLLNFSGQVGSHCDWCLCAVLRKLVLRLMQNRGVERLI